MKSFVNYLTESKKTYEFKVKVAGELDEEYTSMLRGALEKFSIVNMSKGKRTPIQEVPLDFPQLKNSNVTVFDVEVNYPTTPEVLENYLAQVCGYPAANFKVLTANQAAEEVRDAEASKKENTEPLLGTEYDKEDNQELVGEKRISSFLKDLASDAKARKCEGQPTEKASVMPEADTGISPIGSKAQKGK